MEISSNDWVIELNHDTMYVEEGDLVFFGEYSESPKDILLGKLMLAHAKILEAISNLNKETINETHRFNNWRACPRCDTTNWDTHTHGSIAVDHLRRGRLEAS